MSDLSAVEAKLPPGFRFHPKDEELVCDYLMKKVTSANDRRPLLIEVDLNKCEPWDIPESALVGGKECYFYSQRDRKYSTGLRTNRATATGYWKATGKDRPVLREGTLVGMRKTLVFYQGRAPKGRKTDWVMHEFRLEGPLSPPKLSTVKEDWVLCRVLLKNRDEVTKQGITGTGTGGCRGNTSPSSTSPPYTMTSDDQTHRDTNNVYDQLQVPAGFSILTPHQHDQNNQNSATTFSYISQMNTNFLASANFQPNSIGGFGMEIGSYLKNTSSSGDDQRKVMKAVLNELASTTHSDVKGRSSSFGEESSESFLSDVELSNMWNHYS